MAAADSDAAPADAVEYFSPSKVNLFLRVVRRREDGYHDLASLFHVIDLGDDMKFAKSTGSRDTLVCSDDTIPLDSSNLVIKALDLWRRKTGSTQHFWVELVKNVPHGAGLGGGSGNAATAMWAANELCGRPASEAELLEWSGDIGSDGQPVPVGDMRGRPPLDMITVMGRSIHGFRGVIIVCPRRCCVVAAILLALIVIGLLLWLGSCRCWISWMKRWRL